MKTWLLPLITLTLMSFSGCEREHTVRPANAQELIGVWKLIDPAAYKVTLQIDPIIQTWEKLPVQVFDLSGESAVNQYNSSLSYKAYNQPEISIAPIGSTKRAGSTEAMQFEQTYYANLKSVNRYEVTDENRLKLYYQGGVLVYEKKN